MSLDPSAQAVLDMIKAAGGPLYETLSPATARELYLAGRAVLAPDSPPVASVEELSVDVPHGPVALRYYRPRGSMADQILPVLVFFHGGGWVIGDLDTHDVVCRHLANRARAAVVAVDYRMGPEHRFPAAVDDAFASLRFVADRAAALKLDPTRLAVGGDSAGGNLAAVVSLLARDRGLGGLRLQLLIYPATDFTGDYASQSRFAEGYLLTRANQAWFRGHYLADPADAADWRASPLRAESHRNLPPAYILTAGFDPLCDEGEAYAKRLESQGVAVTRRLFPGQIHGFITMGKMIPEAGTALDEAGDALRTHFS
jgi:acetyl esterase